jgi:hypothetical protein
MGGVSMKLPDLLQHSYNKHRHMGFWGMVEHSRPFFDEWREHGFVHAFMLLTKLQTVSGNPAYPPSIKAALTLMASMMLCLALTREAGISILEEEWAPEPTIDNPG